MVRAFVHVFHGCSLWPTLWRQILFFGLQAGIADLAHVSQHVRMMPWVHGTVQPLTEPFQYWHTFIALLSEVG